MMMEKLLIEEQIIKRWHQKTITRPSPIEIHPKYSHAKMLFCKSELVVLKKEKKKTRLYRQSLS